MLAIVVALENMFAVVTKRRRKSQFKFWEKQKKRTAKQECARTKTKLLAVVVDVVDNNNLSIDIQQETFFSMKSVCLSELNLR